MSRTARPVSRAVCSKVCAAYATAWLRQKAGLPSVIALEDAYSESDRALWEDCTASDTAIALWRN